MNNIRKYKIFHFNLGKSLVFSGHGHIKIIILQIFFNSVLLKCSFDESFSTLNNDLTFDNVKSTINALRALGQSFSVFSTASMRLSFLGLEKRSVWLKIESKNNIRVFDKCGSPLFKSEINFNLSK